MNMTNNIENLWQVRLSNGEWFYMFRQTDPEYNYERGRYEFQAYGLVDELRHECPKMDFATARNVRDLIGNMAEVVHVERG